MDSFSEFNALASLTQKVLSDLQHSYGGWELVSQKAIKLSHSLRTTAQAFQAFVDAIQSVSDLANNLKGASRDVGACVTRICMRERTIETKFRSLSDALVDQVAVTLQQRTSFWKARTTQLDKVHAKHVKKARNTRRQTVESPCVDDEKRLCEQALLEHRQQFTFFLNTLLPFLKEEVSLLDEGSHIRQVTDEVTGNINKVDPTAVVQSILADLQGGGQDDSWKYCLPIGRPIFDSRDPSPTKSFSSEVLGDIDSPSPAAGDIISISGGKAPPPSAFHKPPTVQRRPSSATNRELSMCAATVANNRLSDSCVRMRPQSFSVDGGEANSPILPVVDNVSCSSSDATSSAALIQETLHQIDQLGSDLENYCNSQEVQHLDQQKRMVLSSPQRIISQRNSMPDGCAIMRPNQLPTTNYDTIRMRNGGGAAGDMERPSQDRRPPPPERRCSQITAATPTAPSIAEQRRSAMGSRQSLASSSTNYTCLNTSSQDLRYSNCNPWTQKYPL